MRGLEAIVGPPYGLWSALRMGGTGYPRMVLDDAPGPLLAAIDRLEDRRSCSLEVRPKGLLMRCRQRLETLALPISWDQLERITLSAPGRTGHGRLSVHLAATSPIVLLVPRDHWVSVSRNLSRHLPQGRFKTLPAFL